MVSTQLGCLSLCWICLYDAEIYPLMCTFCLCVYVCIYLFHLLKEKKQVNKITEGGLDNMAAIKSFSRFTKAIAGFGFHCVALLCFAWNYTLPVQSIDFYSIFPFWAVLNNAVFFFFDCMWGETRQGGINTLWDPNSWYDSPEEACLSLTGLPARRDRFGIVFQRREIRHVPYCLFDTNTHTDRQRKDCSAILVLLGLMTLDFAVCTPSLPATVLIASVTSSNGGATTRI